MSKMKYYKIIDEIQKIRSKNNENQMSILMLAFKYASKQASEIFAEIHKEDKHISALAKKLTKKINV